MQQQAIIGSSIVIKGEVSGSENLLIEGTVEGSINLRDHQVTIGSKGRIRADITAKSITIMGDVKGNVSALEKVELKESGRLEGDITAPNLVIAEGAYLKGGVEMVKPQEAAKPAFSPAKPAQAPRPSQVSPHA